MGCPGREANPPVEPSRGCAGERRRSALAPVAHRDQRALRAQRPGDEEAEAMLGGQLAHVRAGDGGEDLPELLAWRGAEPTVPLVTRR